MDYTSQIKKNIAEWGADLVGIANVEPLKELKTNPRDLLDPFLRAVSSDFFHQFFCR